MEKQRFKLLISYDGTDFCGWQRQDKLTHPPSVQQIVEKSLSQIYNEPVAVCASGRTDSGTHAIGQVIHFETSNHRPSMDLCWASRGSLPSSIVIKKAWLAPKDFHATSSATHKTYIYFIHNHIRPSALMTRYSAWIREPLDIDYMNAVSSFLVKKQDFKSMQSTGTPVKTTIREIYQAQWKWRNPQLLQFTITGSGFLKQMVRNIIGTTLKLAKDGLPPETMAEILAACDRRQAGPTAPAQGLFLRKVYYPSELDKRCRQI